MVSWPLRTWWAGWPGLDSGFALGWGPIMLEVSLGWEEAPGGGRAQPLILQGRWVVENGIINKSLTQEVGGLIPAPAASQFCRLLFRKRTWAAGRLEPALSED